MAISLFGYSFQRKPKLPIPETFTPKDNDDGAVVISAAGAYGTYVDLDGTVRSEAELINRYKEMALHPEIDAAADEIVNEAINTEEQEVVKLNLDDLDQPKKVKDAIEECFNDVVRLLDFRNNAYNIFKKWYIDGRLYFHAIIDKEHPEEGIQELRYIDPRKIRKVREVVKKNVRGGEAVTNDSLMQEDKNEYYIYNEKGFNTGSGRPVGPATTGLKIARDTIIHAVSGLTDVNGTMVLSYLHKAIKALNQLRTLEDANVIYCLSRAPERRVWYIDVGNLPKMKAEQYVRDIMVKHKNRLIYDSASGEVRDDRKFMTMLEDYWLPRRGDGKGTQVETLPAGQNMGEMENVKYFQRKLYASLHVPLGRLYQDDMYSMGQDLSAGISREEIKFGKFIGRLRNQFSKLFISTLEKQIVLKHIMTIEDFQRNVVPYLRFVFTKDNFFMEMKDNQVLLQRIDVAHQMADLVGRYYSNEWIIKNVLKQSDEEMEKMRQEISEEMMDPIYNPPMPMEGGPGDDQGMEDGNQEMEPSPEASDQLQRAKQAYDMIGGSKAGSQKMIPNYKKANQIISKNAG